MVLVTTTMALMLVVAATPAMAQFDGFFDSSFSSIFCDNDSCDNGFFPDDGPGISQNGEPQSDVAYHKPAD